MADTELVNVFIEGSDEAIGFIEITPSTTFDEARSLIMQDIDEAPANYNFLIKNHTNLVKVAASQELKLKVSRFAPDIYLRRSVSDALSAGSLSALSSTLSSTNTSPPGTIKHGKLTRIPTKDEILKELEIQTTPRGSPLPPPQRTISDKSLKNQEKKMSQSLPVISTENSDEESEDHTSDNSGAIPAFLTPTNRDRSRTLRSVTVIKNIKSAREFWLQSDEKRNAISLNSTPERQRHTTQPINLTPLLEHPVRSFSVAITPPKVEIESPSSSSKNSNNNSQNQYTHITNNDSEGEDYKSHLAAEISHGWTLDISPGTSSKLERTLAMASPSEPENGTKDSVVMANLVEKIDIEEIEPLSGPRTMKKIQRSSSILGLEKEPSESTVTMEQYLLKSVPLIELEKTTDWKIESPFRNANLLIPELEKSERYEEYFKDNFSGREFSNYVGIHSKIGPIVVSILNTSVETDSLTYHPAVIRTSKGEERAIIESNGKAKPRDLLRSLKETYSELIGSVKLIEKVGPEMTTSLLNYERLQTTRCIKIGIMYGKEGQTNEEEMLNNREGSQQYEDFLGILGNRIELKGWKGYTGGLDAKTGTTGQHSVFTNFMGLDVMFHVSTLLPYTPNDEQQIERKRHLFNDIVLIIFKEGNTPFNPDVLKSQFTHIVFVVSPIENLEQSSPKYRISIASKQDVPVFGPPLPQPPIFQLDEKFKNFLLTKLINSEMAAMTGAPVFATKHQRTRKELLNDLVNREIDKPIKTNDRLTKLIRNPFSDSDTDLPKSPRNGKPLTLTVKSPDLVLKTVVNEDWTVSDLISKLKRKFPGDNSHWGLAAGERWLDGHVRITEYTNDLVKSGMIVDFKPKR